MVKQIPFFDTNDFYTPAEFVLDSPNIIFDRNGFSIRKAHGLQNWLVNIQNAAVIVVITSKMIRMAKRWVNRLKRKLKRKVGISFYHTKHHDPDAVILKIATIKGFCVISNDHYRQQEYNIFRNISLYVFGFRFTNNNEYKLIITEARCL